MKITQDLHCHTNLSRCAPRDATVESYIDTWVDLGLETVGIADHFWDSRMPIPCPGRTRAYETEEIWKLKEHVATLDTKGVRVLFGGETEYDYTNRGVACHPETAAALDFLIVPHDHSHLTMPSEWQDSSEKTAKFILDAWYDIMESNIAKYITAMAHPFMIGAVKDFSKYFTDKQLSDAFSAAKELDIAVEINACGLIHNTENKKLGELLKLDQMRMFEIAKDCGCKFTFGSDAHHFTHYFAFPYEYAVALHLGLTDGDIKLV